MDWSDGCETDLNDNNNCGACGNVCPDGTHCYEYMCIGEECSFNQPIVNIVPDYQAAAQGIMLRYNYSVQNAN